MGNLDPLETVLTKADCARCRLCCSFDRYDLWETPVITPELYRRVRDMFPEQAFVHREDCYILRMEGDSDAPDAFQCPMLDPEKGCVLGEEKPFDCRIWPLRVMSLRGTLVITLSPACPTVRERPLGKIRAAAEALAPEIFSYAERFPTAVRNYSADHVILLVEPD